MALDLKEFISGLTVSEPLVSENLTIYPLSADPSSDSTDQTEYLLLEEALKLGSFKIGETSESGEVNTVLITNMTGIPVLILDGEEILGAKQNRMVNATVLIAAGKETPVPVSCVERGRWRYQSDRFDHPGVFGYSTLRRQKAEQVAFSLKFERKFNADQGAIWQEIDRKQSTMECHSPTDALHDVYESLDEQIAQMVDKLTSVTGQIGHIVFINNCFTCLDLFDQPVTLAKMWPKLVKSYAVEALENMKRKVFTTKPDPAVVLSAVADSDLIAYPSVGLGLDLRLTGTGVIGSGLAIDDRIVHLSVFKRCSEEGTNDRNENNGRICRPSYRRRNLG